MKVEILKYREGFNKVTNTKLLKDNLGYRLADAKDVTDRILKGEKVALQIEETEVINQLGKNGLDVTFEYEKENVLYEGWTDERGMEIVKVKTEYSENEILETLKQIDNPVLVKSDSGYLIMNNERDSILLIENSYLAQSCKEYLLKKGVEIYESIE